MEHSKLYSHKMRGVIDPYTLGFLISLIGGTITYIAHSDDQPDTATVDSSQQQSQVATPTHVESEHINNGTATKRKLIKQLSYAGSDGTE